MFTGSFAMFVRIAPFKLLTVAVACCNGVKLAAPEALELPVVFSALLN